MLEQENNLEVLNTNEQEVVSQIETGGIVSNEETSVEPLDQTPPVITEENSLEETSLASESPDQENNPPVEKKKRVAKKIIKPEKLDSPALIAKDNITVTPVGNSEHAPASLLHEDEDEDEESKMMDEEDAVNLDYSSYSKDQLLNLAVEAPKMMVAREAVKKIQNIRPFFDDLLKLDRQEQLQKYLEAGNEEETFEWLDDGSKQRFYDAFKIAQESRAEEKKRIENEKLKNLATKNAIIERIKVLTESDETIDSLNEIKQLQNDWKAIRVVPKTNIQELYDRYHFYLDKFYDNFAINRELKELDRQKNLGIKIDLCNKVDALQKEPSLKKAFIMLAKYQEEFKNTGPVPKEFSEEIWTRFKSTIDEIYTQRKAQFDEIQEKRVENLKLKEVLVEKARLISNHIPTKGADWKSNFDELNKLMEEWKTIGQVPKAQNETIWHNFREQFTIFTKNRNEQFKKINTERKANISVREDIIKRAEELKDHEDFNFATKEIIKLQEDWKKSGPVPDSVSQTLWKKFRKTCDEFFNRKQSFFENRKGAEDENLQKKQAIIAEMEELQNNNDGDEVLAKLKEVQARWNEIGFVPLKNKKDIGDSYHNLLDVIYKKFRQNRDSYKRAHLNEHYNQIANQPGGDKKLGDDERRLREKIKALKTEIETWENNIEFFARSKNAEKFRKDIEDKIAKVNGQIDSMNKELIALRAAKPEKV
ncbi:MAG: DUF349 domain-containing protein [Bacteroidia bacterium]